VVPSRSNCFLAQPPGTAHVGGDLGPICPDIETGAYSTGVRTVLPATRLQNFSGTFALRKLRPCLESAAVSKLMEFRESVIGRPFNFSLSAARKSLCRRHTEHDCSSFFCSSLVAEAYQHLGILLRPPTGPLPNNVLPGDFSDGRLPLTNGYSLEASSFNWTEL
jgi:hypothetical protein